MLPSQRPSSTSQQSETTPLLAESQDNVPTPEHCGPFTPNQTRQLLILICVAILTIDFGSFMSVAPQIEIFESIICKQHGHGIDALVEDSPCKAADIQGELALLNGWKDTLEQLPGIILAVPYGLMADKVGRKPVMLLCLGGVLLEQFAIALISWWSDFIPIRAVLIAPIFLICGGGPQIATSMAFTMVTDIFPVEKRSSIFFILAAAALLSEIVATPLSAFLMTWTPWLPYLLGLLFEIAGMSAATCVSETRAPDLCENNADTSQFTAADTIKPRGWWTCAWDVTRGSADTIRSILNMNMVCVALAFTLGGIGRQALQLIIQYASKCFSWSFSRASLVIALKGIVNLGILLIVLPKISNILVQRMSPVGKDLRISQGSAWALTLGAALMAIAAHPVPFIFGTCVFACGWGFYSTLRTVATALVEPTHIGVLNTTLAVAQGIGSMVAGPIMASAFRRGLVLGNFWVGLPFMVAAALFFGASCLTHSIRVSMKK
ncbi:hypothetical protein ETB97_012841 [Aspergillus alliaceus]|uniref:Major facilitator superfamily (MFS) profile domain-containing protein n=1 Tax=Petromyces alliaceus TaxID=209559 RepID=A0A8H6A800_PETAA|nr:hypothetical protein ETB97_012841 [Aspergillus burnettii]